MCKLRGVHEYVKQLFLLEHQMGDAKATLGLTHLDELFLLCFDEFLCRTVIQAAEKHIISKASGDSFDAKRFYKKFTKWFHRLNLICVDMYKTIFIMRFFLNAMIPVRCRTRTSTNARETQRLSAILFNHMRLIITDSPVPKHAHIATLTRVRRVCMWTSAVPLLSSLQKMTVPGTFGRVGTRSTLVWRV